MPPTHVSAFPVRFDECDMYGHVNHAVYLRYMEEAAFQATAAIGYPIARYQEMSRAWFVRETDVEYLSPLRYGDAVEVKTWAVDFRRVRGRRAYELRRAADGEVVARGHSDWVYMDTEQQRPVSIPDEMVAAFLPDGPAPGTPPREPFPDAPPPPPGAFRHCRRVEWADVDPAGHANNAVYLSYLEDCAVQDAVSRGWPISRMVDDGGFAIVVRRYRIEYRQQARLDDELELATWVSDVRRVTAVRHYTIRRPADGALLARARARWAWIDLESGRPRRIPSDLIADLAPAIVAG